MFPFALDDLISWTVKRTDGTVAKFTLTEAVREEIKKNRVAGKDPRLEVVTSIDRRSASHLSEFCSHTPKTPVAEFDEGDRPEGSAGPLRLYCGDFKGARDTVDNFDFVIDGGDVISLYGRSSSYNKLLEGDPDLIQALRGFTCALPKSRVLQIDWPDRKAPDLIPEFWTRLNSLLSGDVMTCCQGGHGRTGTSFCSLLLNNAPDYDAADALTHLRAVHCPRAVESLIQHDYIDNVAVFLGREGNTKKAREIRDYKKAFLASDRPTAVRTRKILGW